MKERSRQIFNLLKMDLARATLVLIRVLRTLINSIAKNLHKLQICLRFYSFCKKLDIQAILSIITFSRYTKQKNIFFLFFSNFPIDLFFTLIYYSKHHAGVAKLVIALACHAGDHGFEPRHSRLTFQHDGRFFLSGNSAVGSARRSGR